MIEFHVGAHGVWTVTKHVREHNHPLCNRTQIHLLRSHRKVTQNDLSYLKDLQSSGVAIADGIRLLKNQSGGSPLLGFTARDAYNNLALDNFKKLDGSDSNTLIQIFRKRQQNEDDFFFDFELDSDARLCNFFWRDGRMKKDYDIFGDLLVHDTTYRTNKYDMICGPFVGMNHHCMNIMFGCGFLMNERIESFVWLFNTFLRSMEDKHPQTIMTDQSAAMAAAISQVFPNSCHRLCVWHIGENSKKHIKSLRSKKDFMNLFNYLLKYTETEVEFNLYWARMVTEFQCQENSWIQKLYDLRKKWCPAFNKNYFSGGVLSSQRSETTNHSVSRKLFRTAGLCDLYNSFAEVVLEWRARENGEDLRCMQGRPEMAIIHAKLLTHAREIYTIEIFLLFERQFIKAAACHQECKMIYGSNMIFHVWQPSVDAIRHEVKFNYGNTQELIISCTCKMISEVGILCCHCLRILNIHCIKEIPDKYIMKRWTKDIIESRNRDIPISFDSRKGFAKASSIWRIQMARKFQNLISASEHNSSARKHCEDAFENARKNVIVEVGAVHLEDCQDSQLDIIQNPISTRSKGERNKRPKSIVEKKCNQAKGRNRTSQKLALQTKIAIHSSMQETIPQIVGEGYLAHPSSEPSHLLNFIPNSLQ